MGVLGNSVGLGVHELEYIGGSATTAILYVDSHGAAEILNGLDSGVGHLKRWQDVRVSHGHGVSLSTDKATPDLGLAAGRRPGTHASAAVGEGPRRLDTIPWHPLSMHVSRIGFTSLKGARHLGRPFVDLTRDGPVGDREFCLVDQARERVLRTVENPTLVQTRAGWDAGVLTVTLPGATVEGVPAFTGETRLLDYWGRRVALQIVDGPWAAAYSTHLGYDVVLARSTKGDVVYGASVSLVTTGSLDELSRRVGTRVLDAQLRATFTVHTDAPHREDAWIGGRLALGEAEVEVRRAIPRCRVIDLDPDTGMRRTDAMRALADYRRQGNEVVFGVDAVVTKPGRVYLGDVVEQVGTEG